MQEGLHGADVNAIVQQDPLLVLQNPAMLEDGEAPRFRNASPSCTCILACIICNQVNLARCCLNPNAAGLYTKAVGFGYQLMDMAHRESCRYRAVEAVVGRGCCGSGRFRPLEAGTRSESNDQECAATHLLMAAFCSYKSTQQVFVNEACDECFSDASSVPARIHVLKCKVDMHIPSACLHIYGNCNRHPKQNDRIN